MILKVVEEAKLWTSEEFERLRLYALRVPILRQIGE